MIDEIRNKGEAGYVIYGKKGVRLR